MVSEGQPQAKKDRLRNIAIILLVLLAVAISVTHLVLNIITLTLPVFEWPAMWWNN